MAVFQWGPGRCWAVMWCRFMRFSVYGRDLEIRRTGDGWRAFDIGTEGKIRPAWDVGIPAEISREELLTYLADLLHETASERCPDARPIN